MNWIVAILIVCSFVGLHVHWRRRFFRAQLESHSQISELIRTQREFAAETSAEQQALFNSMLEGVIVLNEHDRIRLTNDSFTELFSVSSDIRGKTLMEALRILELSEIIGRIRQEQRVFDVEIIIAGPPKRVLEVNAAAVLDRNGAQKGAIIVFHDLTRIKQLESTRQEFVANVSHELRTPLALIKGFVETLNNGAKDNPQTTAKFLQTIGRNANRLSFLIDELLTISQLESGQVVLNIRPVNLHEEAQRTIDDLQSRAQARGTQLMNDVPLSLWSSVDPDRLQQVFFNLLDNAIKYGNPNGYVVIGGCETTDGKVEISVKDDGHGIPTESLERIFERFYRLDKARSRDQRGTGLGLSIVKHIVQCHGGTAWATSELGKGSSFHFTLRSVVPETDVTDLAVTPQPNNRPEKAAVL